MPKTQNQSKPSAEDMKAKFLTVVKGIPNHVVCRAMNELSTGTNWHGCTKTDLSESWGRWTLDDSWNSIPSRVSAFDEFEKLLAKHVDAYAAEKKAKAESKQEHDRMLKANLESLKKELVLAKEALRQAKALSPPTIHQQAAFDYIVDRMEANVGTVEFKIRTHPLTPTKERYGD